MKYPIFETYTDIHTDYMENYYSIKNSRGELYYVDTDLLDFAVHLHKLMVLHSKKQLIQKHKK